MAKKILSKLASAYVWGHVIAVAIVVAMICLGVRFGLDFYTHHGQSIVVPNLVNLSFDEAQDRCKALGLEIVVSDTGYVKTLPPDCILEQSPLNGKRIKSDHVVYVTVNSAGAPTLVVPDVIDNGSYREASATLASMGFKMGEPEWIPGEKDWIYGMLVNGRHVKTGDRIPTDAKLILQVGDGTRSAGQSISYESAGLDFDDMPPEEPEYEYEIVEVPIDENGNEISPSAPADQTSATPAPAE